MNFYEDFLSFLENEGLLIRETKLNSSADGLSQDGVIVINNKIETNKKKFCILSEEFGHYMKTYSNIQKLDTIENEKQEYKARLYAYKHLISLDDLSLCLKNGINDEYDMANELNITYDFLVDALECYKNIYGDKKIKTNNGYLIFTPTINLIN